MLNLNRRELLAASAASVITQTLPAFAATPFALKHGIFEVSVVSDGHLILSSSFLAPEAPPAEREALLKAAGQTGEQYNSPTNVTLIRAASDLILVDMGSGGRFMPTAGKLWDNLKTAGIDKVNINKVIFTHGHPDHLWGTVDELDDLVMPDATFFVAGAEWDFWHGDNAARGYDDPIAVLPLDRLHPAEAGKHTAAGDLEDVAVAIFDQCTAAAHGMEDPIRQDLLGAYCFGGSRRIFRNCARRLHGRRSSG